MIPIEQVKQLREETGVSVSDCKKALTEAKGDLEKAREILRKWGKEVASKKTSREVKQGIIETYLHPNRKVGVMVQIYCETDFVAKSEEFKKLAHEICLQIAAMKPVYLKTDDIPEEFTKRETEIYREQFKNSGKPQKVISQIIEGKLKNTKEEISLFSQSWIKDETKTIKDLIEEYIAKLGENIIVKKFIRYDF